MALLKAKLYGAEDATNRYPDDEDLKDGFIRSHLSNQQVKAVLYLIEKSIRTAKDSTKLRGFNEYSVEHLMPKNWRSKWDAGLGESDAKIRDNALRKIGNLAIITTALNSSVRDAAWQIKKDGSGAKKGLREYGSGIKTLERYLDREAWNEAAILQRANDLFEYAVTLWPYDLQFGRSIQGERCEEGIYTRDYWNERADGQSMALFDQLVNMVKAIKSEVDITYNKSHIAVGTSRRNFSWYAPRKEEGYCRFSIRVGQENIKKAKAIFENAGIAALVKNGDVFSVPIREADLKKNQAELNKVFDLAIKAYS